MGQLLQQTQLFKMSSWSFLCNQYMSGSALPTPTQNPQQFEFTNDVKVAEEFSKGLLVFAQSQ
jgi:hypothetical protein